jgi:hypothetical protein
MSASGRDTDCSTPSPTGGFIADNHFIPLFGDGHDYRDFSFPDNTRTGAPPSLAATTNPQDIDTLGMATTLATSVGNQGKHSRVMRPAGDKWSNPEVAV